MPVTNRQYYENERNYSAKLEAENRLMRDALGECRKFVAAMYKPAAPGTHFIQSYEPCGSLIAKIDAALKE